MSSTMRSIWCDEENAVRTSSIWSGGIRECISRSSIGTMPLSGVRISWLMVARNSPLAITAASAACLAWVSSFSSWVWRLISCCSALTSASPRRLRSLSSRSLASCLPAANAKVVVANRASRASTKAIPCHGPWMPDCASASDNATPAAAPSANQRALSRLNPRSSSAFTGSRAGSRS